MIVKKKINRFPFVNLIIRFLNKLIQVIGSISLLIIILLVFYYFNSGMYEKYKPLTVLKEIDKVIFSL